jgi:hypothetical protein
MERRTIAVEARFRRRAWRRRGLAAARVSISRAGRDSKITSPGRLSRSARREVGQIERAPFLRVAGTLRASMPSTMSRREHGVLRIGALVVLALCAWLPRGSLAVHPPASSSTLTAASIPAGAAYVDVSFAGTQAQAE